MKFGIKILEGEKQSYIRSSSVVIISDEIQEQIKTKAIHNIVF